MPIYEYRCESCGEALEKIQKFSDPPLTDCPVCGKSTLKKLVSASSFRLKGSGWYETDFKHKKKPETDSKGSRDKSSEGGKSDKAGDKAGEKTGEKAASDKSSGTASGGD